ncbi:MAG: hypothetical protein KTR28_03905 [Micavibrio sp.]|nr:hypothetical protein [Micavibrio sp.]
MLIEWIHSVRSFKQSAGIDICILDVGLTDTQKEKLKPLVAHIINPDWPTNIPASRIRGREYLKACVCRPFIPKIFPGYDTYIWMDADTWLQDWRGIELYIEGARRGKLAIASQSDRSYLRQFRIKWLAAMPIKVRGFYYTNALKAFGFKTAKKLLPFQVLNAGIFAMRADAPHWDRWQELVKNALIKGKVFTAEQLTLGVLTYLENYPVEILPAYCNWLCEVKPLWDEAQAKFIEPNLPNEVISVVHISGWDDMRLDRSIKTDFKTLQGNEIQMSYRYCDFDGEAP